MNRPNFRFVFTNMIFVALLTLISCGQAKRDARQMQQSQTIQPTQEQAAPVSTTPAQPAEAVTAAQPAQSAPVVQPAQSAPVVQPPTTQSQTAVMLNPPHGQPYHRCDIPVGAPLPASPAVASQPTANPQVQASTSQPSVSAPAAVSSPVAPTVENVNRAQSGQTPITTNANSGTKPRLNPAHGQPYHRCDIPVGSPLP